MRCNFFSDRLCGNKTSTNRQKQIKIGENALRRSHPRLGLRNNCERQISNTRCNGESCEKRSRKRIYISVKNLLLFFMMIHFGKNIYRGCVVPSWGNTLARIRQAATFDKTAKISLRRRHNDVVREEIAAYCKAVLQIKTLSMQGPPPNAEKDPPLSMRDCHSPNV